jgi:hypothetical protein
MQNKLIAPCESPELRGDSGFEVGSIPFSVTQLKLSFLKSIYTEQV